jgi:RNA polymerase sigma factor (sigma-70 family)
MDLQSNLDAANRIFTDHGPTIRSMIYFHVNDPSTADDIYQNLFLSLVRRPIPYIDKTPLGYLWRAIANDVRDAARRKQSYGRMLDNYRSCKKECDKHQADPLASLAKTETQIKLIEMIEQELSPQEARAVIERYVSGESISGTAEKIKVDKRTVSHYLCTALKKLRHMAQKDQHVKEELVY